jgi:hypothetical protein
MSAQIQYDLFENPQIVELKDSLTRVRKGTYARLNALEKKQREANELLDILVRNICKNES